MGAWMHGREEDFPSLGGSSLKKARLQPKPAWANFTICGQSPKAVLAALAPSTTALTVS